ncbi:LysR substrate-binding domain-containing protein [Mesorhizobium sp. 2RAF21]|uniref:LysR substrate-binding domain-containing protein n=1 Tax=Mesorhizobium sp. 2RAF21 TaxID=3232995 RepID=UPI003F9473E1
MDHPDFYVEAPRVRPFGSRPRLPPLITLRAFEAVGRLGSIKAAGDELGVSPTVISRHIRNLQLDLDATLVEPQGRGIALSVEGRGFHDRVTRAFDIMIAATSAFRPPVKRSLDIWCKPGIANQLLLPLLPDLESRFSDHEILLKPTMSRPDLMHDEADAEIIYLSSIDAEPSGLTAEILASPRVLPVISPAFYDRHGPISATSELLRLPLIHDRSSEAWERWFKLAGVTDVPALRGTRLWQVQLTIEAARLGHGVAIANELLVKNDLRSGRLVEIGHSNVVLGSYFFITAAKRGNDKAIDQLRGWIKEVIRQTLD